MADRITEQTIERTASLAKIAVSGEEVIKLKAEMERMLELADVLAGLKAGAEGPEADASENGTVFREDCAAVYADCAALLEHAPKVQDGCWQVPRSIGE